MKKPPPRSYCSPIEAFGDRNAKSRHWLVPTDPKDLHTILEFRTAVIQHAFVASIRAFKFSIGMTQVVLAQRDGRDYALDRWEGRLNGRMWMTPIDYAVAYQVLEGWTAPSTSDLQCLLRVAEKLPLLPTDHWTGIDT